MHEPCRLNLALVTSVSISFHFLNGTASWAEKFDPNKAKGLYKDFIFQFR